jgi:hypothetical protein
MDFSDNVVGFRHPAIVSGIVSVNEHKPIFRSSYRSGWDKKQIIVSAIVSGLAHAQNAFPHAQQIIVSADEYTLFLPNRNNAKFQGILQPA